MLCITLQALNLLTRLKKLEGRALVADNTIDDTYYISNTGFKYTYYPALTQSVEVKIGVFNTQTLIYDWATYVLTGSSLVIDNDYATVTTFANYRTITLRGTIHKLQTNILVLQ